MEKITYIILSLGWDGFPIAYKLQEEGATVAVGQVQSKSELGLEDDEETPEEKEKRLKQFDGMLHNKMTARKLVDALKQVSDKENYFIFCDQNCLFKYAQELLDAGFTKGLFPLESDYEFEKDRDAAMQFVQEVYPDISIIPFKLFSNVTNAVAFLNRSDKVYVIQSKGDYVATMVPKTDDPEMEREQMINQLERNKEEYNKGGIILKEKLSKPIEITPQIVFVDGKPAFTDLDIETKNIGDGENNGPQVGCGTNLIVRTNIDDKINVISFPPAVYEMAAARTGIFVWDISLYFMQDAIYFGEFCSNRFGYDSLMTEITMAGSVRAFFESLMIGSNPLQKAFGSAVRLFNLNKQADREVIAPKDNMFFYEVYKKDDKVLSLGYCWDLGVATGCGDTIIEAVDEVYGAIREMSFKELYCKSKNDFLDFYPTSILFRFMETNHIYYDAPDYESFNEKSIYEKKIRDMEQTHSVKMTAFKNQVSSLLQDEEQEE